jgi:1-acyl-sn-glycerol-3-phosphate acyltransferase
MRWLAERNLFRAPGVAHALRWVGAVEGTPEAAVDLLRAGELVGVYPGGVDDSFKLSSERYVLQWGARAGFARVAARAGVPVVPVAATGIDELFEVHSRETRIARSVFGSERYDVPIPSNVLPRRVPLNYHALAPILPAGEPDDPETVERLRAATFNALESVLRPYRESLAQVVP